VPFAQYDEMVTLAIGINAVDLKTGFGNVEADALACL